MHEVSGRAPSDGRVARAAGRAGEPARRVGGRAADRPTGRCGRRPAPGWRSAPAARARAGEGDAPGGRHVPRSAVIPASTSSNAAGSAMRRRQPPRRGPSRQRLSREPPAAPPNVAARPAPGGVATEVCCRPSGRSRSRPPSMLARGSSCCARRRHAGPIEFPQNASFHRKLAEEPKNATLLRDALYELTGRRLGLVFVPRRNGAGRGARRPAGRRGGDLPARQGHFRRERGGRIVSMDFGKLMQQAQEMQEQMQKAQEEMEHEVVEGTAGGWKPSRSRPRAPASSSRSRSRRRRSTRRRGDARGSRPRCGQLGAPGGGGARQVEAEDGRPRRRWTRFLSAPPVELAA